MEITMESIKKLREKSGAGMVDCKNALAETSGDIDAAVDILRTKGIAKAAKRGERETSEGVIKVLINENGREAYILEINAETDFVARTERFQDFANQAIDIVRACKPQNLSELLKLPMLNSTIGETLESLSGVIGEKLQIKRFEVLTSEGSAGVYSHMGGRIGVLVALDTPGTEDLAYDVAMQIAASNPKNIDRSEIPAEEIAKEKAIYHEQLVAEGKPANIFDKIIEGKLARFYEEVCLVDQDYIKDDKKKVRDILGDVKVTKFIRYSL